MAFFKIRSLTLKGIIFLLAATMSESSQFDRRPYCGTDPTPEEVVAMEKDFQARLQASALLETAPKYNLNVYFHIVSEDDTVSGGNIPDAAIARQIDVLNEAYRDINIEWTLAGTTRTTNLDWFNNAFENSAQQAAMKNVLRKGGPADLNVFTVRLAENVLGYATPPSQFESNPLEDGVVIRSDTVPLSDLTHLRVTLAQTLSHYAACWTGLDGELASPSILVEE
ncbi:hypothetical protein DXG01_010706 [Tephrocybe rancida]|nr:hypothetical protein DXG01_010706 [Tephrocybe rancida]